MVNFTVKQRRQTMDKPENIRNMSIISHVGHGKSTITDSLVAKAGIIDSKTAGDIKYTDNRKDEKEKGISIKSTAVSLYYEHDIFETGKKDSYLINLIDSPGHVDFSAEVTAALRVTDGALVVVDCVEGVYRQTETVLRQAMTEKVKPALFFNKIDRQILEFKASAEEMYQSFIKVVDIMNDIIYSYEQPDMGDLLLYPNKGNVAFGSGKECWAFTLTTFARIYSKKFKVDLEKMREKLWGDNYYDPKSKKWFKSSAGEGNEDSEALKRAFCTFVMEPIIKLSHSIMDGNIDQMNKILASLEITLTTEEKELTGKNLLKLVMSRWMNAADTLLEIMVLHLPSPKVAQKYRMSCLYEGPQSDEVASSFRDCNSKGALIMYVSKMIPTGDKGRFFAFGRVFGGTVYTGQKVRIMGRDYIPGKKDSLFENSIEKTVIMLGNTVEYIDDVPCGNLVGLVGIDQDLFKIGSTISNYEDAHCIRAMKHSVSPLVRVVSEHISYSPMLLEGVGKLAKADPLISTYYDQRNLKS